MKNYSMLELAFIGDAVHTKFVREYVINNNNGKMNELHKLASKYCSAKWQSEVVDNLNLSTDENEIIRMARNTKTKHIAKNADPAQYHKATAFEALIGYLYVNNKNERLTEILNLSLKEN